MIEHVAGPRELASQQRDPAPPREWPRRALAKAISWRAIATITTMALVYIATGEWTLSLGVGVLEVVVKMALYYLHERAWARSTWGSGAAKPTAPEVGPPNPDHLP